jgi:hypothetical protein
MGLDLAARRIGGPEPKQCQRACAWDTAHQHRGNAWEYTMIVPNYVRLRHWRSGVGADRGRGSVGAQPLARSLVVV